MARWIAFTVVVTAAVLQVMAQSPDPRPKFDAASIKLNVNCGERRGRGGGVLDGGYFATSCVPLRTLIRLAYAPPQHGRFWQTEVLGGAAWLDTEVYDVVAKGAGIGTIDRFNAMLQRLLEDRSGLKIHKEMKEVPIYALTVAKDGLKIHPPRPGSCQPAAIGNRTILPPQPATDEPALPSCQQGSMIPTERGTVIRTGLGLTLDDIAEYTLDRLDRPVVNRTGVAGMFEVHLEYAPDTAQARPEEPDVPDLKPPAPDPAGPSIFTAVQQQLGLKLSPDKGNVEVLVIDHVEKPMEN